MARFVSSLVGIAMGAAQYNRESMMSELMAISTVCEIMTDKRNGKSALERLANLNAR